MHKLPKLALCVRAYEYDLDPEDPLALDMVLRTHFHPFTGKPPIAKDGLDPLFTLPTIDAAVANMEDRLEEVRVDRKAPAAETGARRLAGAIETKVATKALVSVRSQLLKATDKRLAEPVAYYRDQLRDQIAAEATITPADRFLQQYRNEQADAKAQIMRNSHAR